MCTVGRCTASMLGQAVWGCSCIVREGCMGLSPALLGKAAWGWDCSLHGKAGCMGAVPCIVREGCMGLGLFSWGCPLHCQGKLHGAVHLCVEGKRQGVLVWQLG